MEEAKTPPAKNFLGRFLELKSNPSTRRKAYEILEKESGKSRNSLRVAFCKEGKTCSRDSCKFSLPPEVEEALVVICLVHARQGAPLTKRDFLVLASKMAKKEEGEVFSSSFFKDFMSRHMETLKKSHGKITSKTRCYESMLQKTQEFISSMDEIMATNVINKKNMMVFDETIIGVDVSPPIVIGERKDSGGGTVNVVDVCEFILGCYIPFSMPDGTTPFRVFIFRTGPNARGKAFVPAFEPKKERGFRNQPYRLFLQSETGYLTIELFRYIMEEFTKWWTSTRPGLHCFLVCDNLSVHKDFDIVSNARRQGIHFINIMPGSSHWFQVHDQQPFGLLKKVMREEKIKNPTPISAPPEVKKTLNMSRFYEAERRALAILVVRKGFRNVGLWPWNAAKILKICEEHSPVPSQLISSDLMRVTADAINVCEQEKLAALREMMSRLKPVEVKKAKIGKKRKGPDHVCRKSLEEEDKKEGASASGKDKDMAAEPPMKRKRGRPRKNK